MSDTAKVERILSFAEPVTESGCLVWTGAVDSNGYGRTFHNGKARKTTRVLWELVRGAIPSGLCVLHRCDVPACVNIDHLFLGTGLDNHRDSLAKGRAHTVTKRTEDKVRWIREHASTMNNCALGRKFGVHEATIRDAKLRRTWDHVV